MLKIIGIILIVLGFALLAAFYLLGKRDGIDAVRSELDMIVSSGYASEHNASPSVSMQYDDIPVKVPQRKRALSQEALELLEKVENERKQEDQSTARTDTYDNRAPSKKSQPEKKAAPQNNAANIPKRKGTDILPEAKKAAPENRPAPKKRGTDILPQEEKRASSGGTDVMTEKPSPKKKGTDILAEAPAPKKKGTDILTEAPAPRKKKGTDILTEIPVPEKKGTDTLTEAPVPEKKGTEILEEAPKPKRKGTDILTEIPAPKKKGTDILPEEQKKAPERKGTDILTETPSSPGKAGRGTDILPEEGTQKKSGTTVLTWADPAEAGKSTDILEEDPSPKKKGTDILPEAPVPSPKRKGTDILTPMDKEKESGSRFPFGNTLDKKSQKDITVQLTEKFHEKEIEYWQAVKEAGGHGGTDILEKASKKKGR